MRPALPGFFAGEAGRVIVELSGVVAQMIAFLFVLARAVAPFRRGGFLFFGFRLLPATGPAIESVAEQWPSR